MTELQEKFQAAFPEGLINEPLSKYTTFKIGGEADYFYELKYDEDDNDYEVLKKLIKFAKENKIPYFIMGMGNNILFDDKGFRGLVIKIMTVFINPNKKNNQIMACAGEPICRLVEASIRFNLTGLEPWAFLPGTVGGAVRGNAGCNGLECSDIFVEGKVLDPETSEIESIKKDDLEFSYRHSNLKENGKILLEATFQLQKSNLTPEEQKEIKQETLKFRLDKQPTGKTAGSFFKNPSPEHPAGKLIDDAGLKGKKIGDAQISEKHANFIMNTGNATSKEIIELATLAKQEVKAQFDIDLQEEVQIISPTGETKL